MRTLTIMLGLLPIMTFGQPKIIEKENLELNFDKVFFINDTASIYVERIRCADIKYEEAKYGGIHSKSYREILHPTWSDKIELPINEYLFGIHKHFMYTLRYDYNKGYFNISTYEISNPDFSSPLNRKKYEVHCSINFLNNGFIFLSDNAYGEGKYIEILDPNLNQVYYSNESNYYNSICHTCDGTNIDFIIKSRKDVKNIFEHRRFSCNSKKVEAHKNADISFSSIRLIKSKENRIIILGQGKLQCIDNNGNNIWTNDSLQIPGNFIGFTNDMIYAANKSEIFFLEISNGSIKKRIALTELYNIEISPSLNEKRYLKRIIHIESIQNNSVCAIIGQKQKSARINKHVKQNIQFFIINNYGEITFKSEIFNNVEKFFYNIKNGFAKILMDKQYVYYEI